MGIYEHFAAKGITPVQRTGVIPSATGSGHVITCTARRWVVSGQLYCFQLPPARGRREACKPFTDPTSRITNVRINRAAAHRSKLSFGIFSALPASSRLDVQKVRLRRLAIGRTKNLAERGGVSFPPCLRQVGSTYRKYSCAASSSAGRKILPKEGCSAPAGVAGLCHSIPLGRGKSCRKGVGNAVSFPRPHRP